jgi:hypothetical protein
VPAVLGDLILVVIAYAKGVTVLIGRLLLVALGLA